MRSRLALALAVVSLAAGPAFAGGSESRPGPPVGQPAPTLSPEQKAASKYNNGLKHLEKAKEVTAELAGPEVKNRAKLEQKLAEEYDKAIKDFRNADELNPGMHDVHSSLGYALRKTGLLEESLAAYEQALTLKPGYAPAVEYRAEAHLGLGRLADVKEAYMALFTGDRPRADELMAAIDAWVAAHRQNPGEQGVEAVDEFATWAEQRKQIAGQTSSLVKPGNATW